MIEKVAEELSISSYRKIPTLSVSHRNNNNKNDASWLDRKATSSLLDDGQSTAQVNPYELTTKLLDFAIQSGYAELMIGNAQGVMIENGKISGVKVNGSIIPCSKLCVCAGPWSGPMIYDWFKISIPMDGIKSTSLVYNNMLEIKNEPFALFCDDDVYETHLELYPRPNGDLYICGIGGSDYVRGDRLREGGDCASADLILADPKRIEAARNSFKSMSSLGEKYSPDITQACMRPCTSDSLPAMGKLNIEGAYVSTGHNCWGILWSSISGLAMSELIVDGQSKEIDLLPFDPCRFMAKATNRGKKVGLQDIGEQW